MALLSTLLKTTYAGPTGLTGPTGNAATVDVGVTVVGSANSLPTVTNSGNSSVAILDFGLPQSPNVSIGTTTYLSANIQPTITNSGTSGNVVLNFGLPQAPNVSVGTVSTGEPGTTVTVTNSGVYGNVVLNFTIPRGNTGSTTAPLIIACSDETTNLSNGAAKVTFRSPFAMTLTNVRASLSTASSSGTPTIDINKNGTSIFSTLLTIDANEKTSVTALTPAVISTTAIADDDEITIDIDNSGTGAKGLKVALYYTV